MASTIAQEQIDSTRNTPYNSLAANLGQFELKATPSSTSGALVPIIAPRPLLLDSSKFAGRVFERIELGPYQDTLKVTITINWQEGNSNKNYSLSTLVAKNGINNTGTAATGS
jgi:hypothetical protein